MNIKTFLTSICIMASTTIFSQNTLDEQPTFAREKYLPVNTLAVFETDSETIFLTNIDLSLQTNSLCFGFEIIRTPYIGELALSSRFKYTKEQYFLKSNDGLSLSNAVKLCVRPESIEHHDIHYFCKENLKKKFKCSYSTDDTLWAKIFEYVREHEGELKLKKYKQ